MGSHLSHTYNSLKAYGNGTEVIQLAEVAFLAADSILHPWACHCNSIGC